MNQTKGGGSSLSAGGADLAPLADISYWRAVAAGLQREVDAMDRRHQLACEVLAMMCLRINRVVDEAAAGRVTESDALYRLNNLASVITDSLRRYHEEKR